MIDVDRAQIRKETARVRRAKYYACNIDKERARSSERMRRQRLENPDHVKAIKRKSYINTKATSVRRRLLKGSYGITLEQWDSAFEAQGKRCAICSSDAPNGKNWHTDHDHKTKMFRGILCGKCNVAIGMANDSPLSLRKMADYLETKLS